MDNKDKFYFLFEQKRNFGQNSEIPILHFWGSTLHNQTAEKSLISSD